MTPDLSVSAHPAETRMMLDDLIRRVSPEEAPSGAPRPRGPYLTISRQAGSGGSVVARTLATALGWHVLDRELVENLAQELQLDPCRLELMDETRSNWLRDTILNFLDSKLVLQDSFACRIGRVMALAADVGKVVLVGRAGHLILPRQGGLSVRIVAPRAWRIARLSALEEIDEGLASERIAGLDAARADFIRRHFKVDPNDPAAFDLVLDVSTLGEAITAALIHHALKARGFA